MQRQRDQQVQRGKGRIGPAPAEHLHQPARQRPEDGGGKARDQREMRDGPPGLRPAERGQRREGGIVQHGDADHLDGDDAGAEGPKSGRGSQAADQDRDDEASGGHDARRAVAVHPGTELRCDEPAGEQPDREDGVKRGERGAELPRDGGRQDGVGVVQRAVADHLRRAEREHDRQQAGAAPRWHGGGAQVERHGPRQPRQPWRRPGLAASGGTVRQARRWGAAVRPIGPAPTTASGIRVSAGGSRLPSVEAARGLGQQKVTGASARKGRNRTIGHELP